MFYMALSDNLFLKYLVLDLWYLIEHNHQLDGLEMDVYGLERKEYLQSYIFCNVLILLLKI